VLHVTPSKIISADFYVRFPFALVNDFPESIVITFTSFIKFVFDLVMMLIDRFPVASPELAFGGLVVFVVTTRALTLPPVVDPYGASTSHVLVRF